MSPYLGEEKVKMKLTDKSWISLERHVCIICSKEYDTGNLVMKKGGKNEEISLAETMDKYTVTGAGICEECKPKGDQCLFIAVDSKGVPKNYIYGIIQDKSIKQEIITTTEEEFKAMIENMKSEENNE